MTADFRSVEVIRPYEQIVRQIQGGIRSGSFSPGEKLPTERELSDAFGVSRGVVREAIKVLGAMGLVEARQGSGIFVTMHPRPFISRAFTLSISPEEASLTRLFDFRGMLETLSVRCAVERLTLQQAESIRDAARGSNEAASAGDLRGFGLNDDRFHEGIYVAADNPYLAVAASAARTMQGDVANLFKNSPGSISIAARHHLRISEAITARDAEEAVAAMSEHITYTAEVVAQTLQAMNDERVTKGGPVQTP